jgi:hypothetical protein
MKEKCDNQKDETVIVCGISDRCGKGNIEWAKDSEENDPTLSVATPR